MSMSMFASKFEYLLNAMEEAASQENPSAFDYATKRTAVLEYVRKLEAAPPEETPTEPYGYCWFNRHMEYRFTHRLPHRNSVEQPIGEVTPVYKAPPSPQKRNIAPIDDPKEIALCNALASLQLMTCERDDLNAEVAKLSSIETELRAFMRGQGYGHDSHVDTCIWSFFKDRPTGKLRTADLKRKEPKTIIDDGLDMNSMPHSKEQP